MPDDNQRLNALCGQCDEHLRLIEKYHQVEISNRGNLFQISGTLNAVNKTKQAFSE